MHSAHVPRCTRDPSCIMDVLSDAQWRTNTPGLPVLSAQGRTLGNTRAGYTLKKVGEEDATRICSAPCRPHDPASDRRRDLARVRPPPLPPARFDLVRVNMHSSTITSHANTSRQEFTQLLQTTERRTYAGMDAAPRHSSPLSRRLPPAPGTDTGAPSSSGRLTPRGSRYQARFGRSPPLQFDAERLTVSCPDNEMKPYGAPSVGRRGGGGGHAGAPLLKGQEPDFRARVRLVRIK